MYNFSFTEENCQVLDQSLENSTMNSRRGNNKIEVSDQKGVSVSCDFQYDLCTVTLAGWHHGEYQSYSCCQLLVIFCCLSELSGLLVIPASVLSFTCFSPLHL